MRRAKGLKGEIVSARPERECVVAGVEQHAWEDRTRQQRDRGENDAEEGGRSNPEQRIVKETEDDRSFKSGRVKRNVQAPCRASE